MNNTKKYFYKVAGLVFELQLQEDDELNGMLQAYQPFRIDSTSGEQTLFVLQILPSDTPLVRKEKATIDFSEEGQGMLLFKSETSSDYNIEMTLEVEPKGCCQLSLHEHFSQGELNAQGSLTMRVFGMNNAMMMMFAFCGASFDTILIHASVIKRKEKGYLFLGKSGTGKSTHSRLWLKYIDGTELLNDDNPAIRIAQDGTPVVYGTPWSGKTPCYKNDSTSIGGFVRLWQAPENKIEKLSSIKAYAALLPTISCMKWESSLSDGVNRTMNAIIKAVPIFNLQCLPDEAAARMSFQALIGEEEDNHVRILPNEILLGEVKKLVEEGHPVTLRVKGNSMLPFIVGERDSVRLIKANTYHIGDIALAEIHKGHYVLHRIISISGEGPDANIELMGDGNIKGTEQCKRKNLAAVADGILRNGKMVDPYSFSEKNAALWWRRLLPVRRWILAVLRRTTLRGKITDINNSNNIHS